MVTISSQSRAIELVPGDPGEPSDHLGRSPAGRPGGDEGGNSPPCVGDHARELVRRLLQRAYDKRDLALRGFRETLYDPLDGPPDHLLEALRQLPAPCHLTPGKGFGERSERGGKPPRRLECDVRPDSTPELLPERSE